MTHEEQRDEIGRAEEPVPTQYGVSPMRRAYSVWQFWDEVRRAQLRRMADEAERLERLVKEVGT